MLVLSRKTGESIMVNGNIRITILHVEGEVVKVGIGAPMEVPVYRQEVYDELQKSNQAALVRGKPSLPRLPKQALSA
jgi:carbon storage regulator